VLAGKVDVAGKNVVVIASGGNVDPAVFSSALERY
ncbi:pyridoxal-5'-phosphate-dependent protein, partial [Pseudomonas sp. GW460-13]